MSKAAPKLIYHYTSWEGLHGIVRSQGVRMTHAKFLNDWEEIAHGVALVSKIVGGIAMKRSGIAKRVLQRVRDEWDRDFVSADFFVASFCQNGDALEQWRGYTPNGGCSIGFSVDGLLAAAKEKSFWLKQCIYTAKAKANAVTHIITKGERAFLTSRQAEWNSSDLSDSIFSDAMFEVPRFKNFKFASEREWRLFDFNEWKGGEVEFVIKANGIVPFRFMPVERKSIERIILSPFSNPETELGLNWYLNAQSLDHVEVLRSRVPLKR